MKSHTGAFMTLGQGTITSISKKQKLNTWSSTEAELVGSDDIMGDILWSQKLLQAQGYNIKHNILEQDNKSTIILQENRNKNQSQHTRHLDIRYFFISDQIDKGYIKLHYCLTDQMMADYLTKPLQGQKFHKFCKNVEFAREANYTTINN